MGNRKNNHRRTGFTLVEMLVTTMVMLIMVLAMSQMFAIIGQHVTDGRALIEMQGQLRTSAFRLHEDLEGLTLLTRISPELDWEVGYFEYIEGVDLAPSTAPYTVGSDTSPWFVAQSRPPFPVSSVVPPVTVQPEAGATRTAYGDVDDVLMFTARSTGKPFIGRISRSLVTGNLAHRTQSIFIESHDAEFIYWTQWTDSDVDGEIDLGEMTLHRRILLIRPDLSLANMPIFRGSAGSPPQLRSSDLQAFHNGNDLSVRPELTTDSSGSPIIRLRPNSMKDLALRENRIAHLPNTPLSASPIIKVINGTTSSTGFPLIQYFPNRFQRAWLPLHFDDDPTSPASPLNLGNGSGIGFSGTHFGEDIVQTDLLAFDVRAYDPEAPLRQYTGGGDLLTPGDPGWAGATGGNGSDIGEGSYVDLGYGIAGNQTSVSIFFSDQPHLKSGFNRLSSVMNPPNISFLSPVYDTWTWAYERDGHNQNNGRYVSTGGADEATDGIDNDSQDGVDDLDERETMPPYLMPLSGIQVTLRVIELDTRQVRQTSVMAKFAPE